MIQDSLCWNLQQTQAETRVLQLCNRKNDTFIYNKACFLVDFLTGC